MNPQELEINLVILAGVFDNVWVHTSKSIRDVAMYCYPVLLVDVYGYDFNKNPLLLIRIQ